MENVTIRNLIERRSCKRFTDRQVDDGALEQILLAGTYAPNGRGLQSPVIVVLQKPELIERVRRLNAEVMHSDADPFYGAPTVLVVLADPEIGTYIHDGALVMGNLLNAAHALGVDSCYIFRAKETFEMPEGRELLREWGVPERYVGIGNCILGYGAEGGVREAKPRKPDYVVRT